MSTTVAAGDYTVTSTHESADEITAALRPEKDESPEPRVLVDKGQPVEEEPEKDGLSKAASELGRKGGEAAAKAKAKAAKEAKAAKADGEAAEAKASEEDAAEEPEQPAEEPQTAEARKSRAQLRVEQATREAKEAREALQRERAERDRLAAEVREIRSQIQRGPAPAGAEPSRQEPPAKPKSEDFETYEEYLDARDQWNRQEWSKEALQRQRAHAAASQRYQTVTTAIDGYKAAVERATSADPEFRSRVSADVWGLEPSIALEQGQRPSAANWIADEFLSWPESAPALMLYLSENPQDLQRIATLQSPRAVTRELAKLEARLDDATSGDPPSTRPASKPVSQAKPPVRPVTGSPHTADQELDDDAPLSAFVQRFGKRELERSRR